MTEQEMSNLNPNIPGKLIPKLHTRHRKVLGSKLVRRVNPTRMVRRIIPSMCRPPPKPPDRQNSLNDKASNRVMPYVNPKRRPAIHYANEQGKSWDHRPPPKPPYLQNADGERIEALKRKICHMQNQNTDLLQNLLEYEVMLKRG